MSPEIPPLLSAHSDRRDARYFPATQATRDVPDCSNLEPDAASSPLRRPLSRLRFPDNDALSSLSPNSQLLLGSKSDVQRTSRRHDQALLPESSSRLRKTRRNASAIRPQEG